MNGKRITGLAVIMVLVSFLLSTCVSLWSIHVMARKNMEDMSTVLAARVNETIMGRLSEPITVAKIMANDSFLISTLLNEQNMEESEAVESIKTYLAGIRAGHEYEFAFVISDGSSRYYTNDGLTRKIITHGDSGDIWYRTFVDGESDYELDVDNDETVREEWTVYVNARVEDPEGELLGVCGIGVRMASLQSLFFTAEKNYGFRLRLIDTNGRIQVSTDEEEIEKVYALNEASRREDHHSYVFYQSGHNQYTITKYIDNLDWYLAIESGEDMENEWIVQIVTANVLFCLLVMGILSFSIWLIVKRTRALAQASFIDQITGLQNRRSFEEEKARLLTEPREDQLVVMSADLNGLKTVNDTLGHAAGDELIQGAAKCIKTSFGRYGTVYRIGGDEFAAILSISREDLEKARQELDREQAEWSGEKVSSVSLSCGYAAAWEFPSENLPELIRIADERMYAAKTEYYRQAGIDRRRT